MISSQDNFKLPPDVVVDNKCYLHHTKEIKSTTICGVACPKLPAVHIFVTLSVPLLFDTIGARVSDAAFRDQNFQLCPKLRREHQWRKRERKREITHEIIVAVA